MSTFKCPGAEKIRASFPDEFPCACGLRVELWPDDIEARCPGCGRTVRRDVPPSCIEWCAAARECVGDELYERYMRARGAQKEGRNKGRAVERGACASTAPRGKEVSK